MTKSGQAGGDRKHRGKTGVVDARSGEKTIRVLVEDLVKHPMYNKYVRRRTKLAVHDPGNVARPGDLVEVVPCRPISKRKSWRLVRVVRSAAVVAEAE